MRGYIAPVSQIVALEGFIAAPGKSAKIGELIDVTTSAANMLIAMGKARPATPEDLEEENEQPPRDPPSTNPKPPRSR
jgi:hypothetical protein